jgi:hypothetical protein
MRAALILILLALPGCTATPKPFEHNSAFASRLQTAPEKVELTVAPPARMPQELGMRVAAALAVELQSYGVLAVVQPESAPMRLGGVSSTRDVESVIEIEVAWYVERNGRTEGPAISRTRAQPQDYADSTDRLVSRIAQQAAPRVATLMGKPPTFQPRSPGQVAAGVSVPQELPPDPAVTPAAAAAIPGSTIPASPAPPGARPGTAPSPSPPPAPPRQTQVKVLVAPVTGAPSDGNRQLFSGMRRALGSSRIVVIDRAAADTFTVEGSVSLTAIDDRTGHLLVKWVLKDPSGKAVGDLEQSNPVPLAATRGSWAGFGDVVAAAASEGIVQLLDKALSQPR